MTNYNIIKDPYKLEQFIETWLPDLQVGEVFYACLFARKKYCLDIKRIKTDKAQLKRFTANKTTLYSKIKQLECEVDSYLQPNGDPYPEESLALYITPNPRSHEKAAKDGLITLAQLITQPYNNYNPHQELMSCIQKAKSRTCFVDFDFDNTQYDAAREAEFTKFCNRDAYEVLVTRGGFHLLVKPQKVEKQFANGWHKNFTACGCDVRGDNLIPVPGCTQGGHVPYFI